MDSLNTAGLTCVSKKELSQRFCSVFGEASDVPLALKLHCIIIRSY